MQYLIRETRHFYAETIHSGRVRYFGVHGFDPVAPLVAFASKAEAREQIEEAESGTVVLGHGESSRPTLVAVPVSIAPYSVWERLSV